MKRKIFERPYRPWYWVLIFFLLFSTGGISNSVFAEINLKSVEKQMNLKEMLKRDFGLDLKIAGGHGQSRQEPIIVLSSNPNDASMTEMQVLRAIGKGRGGILWRTIARTPIENNRFSIEQVKLEVKEVTETEIITGRTNYYFDVSKAISRGKTLPTAIAFSDKKSKLSLPYEIGWLHYDNVIDNNSKAAGLGKSIAYGAPGTKATIYVYDKKLANIPSNVGSSVVRNEFEAAVSDLKIIHPSASPLSEPIINKALLIQVFNIDSEVNIVALGASRGMFIKLRVTYINNPLLDEVVQQSVSALEELLEVNLQKNIH